MFYNVTDLSGVSLLREDKFSLLLLNKFKTIDTTNNRYCQIATLLVTPMTRARPDTRYMVTAVQSSALQSCNEDSSKILGEGH